VPIKGQFMVAAEFYNPKLGRATSDIATILVNADGSLGGPGTPTILSSPFFPDLNPAIAGSEGLKQFLVTWSSYIETKQGDPIPILFGQTFLTITGAPDGNTYDLYYNFPETYPAVASGSQGDFLVTSTLGQIYGRLWGIP
jgi:hypothetical protein